MGRARCCSGAGKAQSAELSEFALLEPAVAVGRCGSADFAGGSRGAGSGIMCYF